MNNALHPIQTCQAKNKDGLTCNRPVIENSPFCTYHSPRLPAPTIYDWAKTEYLRSLATRIEDFKDTRTFNLREEIGILRVILERLLASVEDDPTLLLRSSEIQQTILTIERLLKTTHEMERQSGTLLTREEVREIATTLLTILVETLESLAQKEKKRFQALQALASPDQPAGAEPGPGPGPEDGRGNLANFLEELRPLVQNPPDISGALETIADRYSEILQGKQNG